LAEFRTKKQKRLPITAKSMHVFMLVISMTNMLNF